MILDQEEARRRLNSPRNLLNALPRSSVNFEPLHKTNGRGKAIPQSLKVIAGVLSKTERTEEITDALEIPKSALKNKNPEVRSAIEQTTEKIRDLALNKLMASLGLINDDSLSVCGAKDASLVARNLASVAHQLAPRDTAAAGVTLVVYAPQQRQEKYYDVIDVKAEQKESKVG